MFLTFFFKYEKHFSSVRFIQMSFKIASYS